MIEAFWKINLAPEYKTNLRKKGGIESQLGSYCNNASTGRKENKGMNGRETAQVNYMYLGTSWIQKAGQGKHQTDLGSGACDLQNVAAIIQTRESRGTHWGGNEDDELR